MYNNCDNPFQMSSVYKCTIKTYERLIKKFQIKKKFQVSVSVSVVGMHSDSVSRFFIGQFRRTNICPEESAPNVLRDVFSMLEYQLTTQYCEAILNLTCSAFWAKLLPCLVHSPHLLLFYLNFYL